MATALQKSNSVLDIDPSGVSIDAVPRRLSDLLAAAQVNLSVSSGAKLPVSRHGAGTQSLSVVLLFEAYLVSKLGQAYKEESEAILGLEEPEAHLHPSAIRSIWQLIASLGGQKIVATHSGELLASVPLLDIVRLRRKVDGSVRSYQLGAGTLTPESVARIEFHLKSTRAELLFARCWLVGEGETEYWLLGGVSDILGLEMERHGVRFVNHKWASLEDYLKLANALGIEWHVLSDGDAQADHQRCTSQLNGRLLADRLTTYTVKHIEVFLAMNGFGHIYEAHISQQKRSLVTAQQGSNQYWHQVLQAQELGSKPLKMQEVLQVMRGNPATIPALISNAIRKAIQLAET